MGNLAGPKLGRAGATRVGAMSGRVILGGAPLGNAADAGARLIAALADTAIVAAEDTRRVRRLAADLDVAIAGRIVSFFEGNESARVPQLLAALHAGQDVLVITDAGMPSISDPGYRLVAAAVAEGIDVSVLPGPSAVTAALAVSGLAVDRFCFEGFLPRKGGDRRRALEALRDEPRTVVFFESPRRLAATLALAAEVLGTDRAAAVCRELSKTYEQVRRGSLAQLAQWSAAGEVRGEITVVLAGAPPARPASVEPAELAAAVATLIAVGRSRKEAIASVTGRYGVAKRQVFDALVSVKP
jgi:16S rRNA (cytidine1402-2'-O)-methyltransferase